MKIKNKTFRLVLNGLLTALALVIFVIELQIPSLTPIPGIKLGLSNIITLSTLFILGPIDALFVLLSRILLGCTLTGQVTALIYSLAGGLLSYFVMIIMKKIVTDRQIFICSIICAIFHNIGQIIAAIIITGTVFVAYYLPILIISGIIAGLFTGLAAQFTFAALKKINFGQKS